MDVYTKTTAVAAALASLREEFKGATVERRHDYGATIHGRKQAAVFIRLLDKRLIISGLYPERLQGRSSGAKTVRITVDPNREPAAIAREIVRRVLPDYLPELVKAQERVIQDRQAADSRRIAAERFNAHPLIHTYGTTGELLLEIPGPGYFNLRFRLSDDGATVFLDSTGTLPAEVFLAMADAAHEVTR